MAPVSLAWGSDNPYISHLFQDRAVRVLFEDFIMDPNHRSSEMEERWINHAETDVFAFFLEEFGKENLPVPMEQAYPSRQFIAFLEKPAPEPSLPDSRNKIGQSIRNFLTRVFRKF